MISVIVGTRPEIIKMAPVMREMDAVGLKYEFLHTNQHYSKEMDADIIYDLKLRKPDHNFQIGSLPQGAQTGRAIESIESYFLEKGTPNFVLVHGDTNASLAGALASIKMHVPVGHVEAGLRSFDRRMPEECNRVLIDAVCDVHFAPTEVAKKNLLSVGVDESSILVCGNTVVDALKEHIELTGDRDVKSIAKVKNQSYILATAHRPENVDREEKLQEVIDVMSKAAEILDMVVVAPLHPRTVKNISQYKINVPKQIKIIDPVGYIDMLALINGSSLILTDSGGLQEEAYILNKPLITLRNSTERPETMSANFLVDTDVIKLADAIEKYETGAISWEEPFGSGDASKQIVAEIKKRIRI